MARYTGPKHKLARREGVNILEKSSQSLDRRLNILPGSRPGGRRRSKMSEYGLQLREKQKMKRIYGLLEKQFRKYVETAERKRMNTGDALTQLLETRLDNVVYRMGFAPSRPMARQLVSHRHVLVNGEKVNIPSYHVKPGDKISLSKKALEMPVVKARLENEELVLPSYVARKNVEGTFLRLPTLEDVTNPVEYQLVVEFYSR